MPSEWENNSSSSSAKVSSSSASSLSASSSTATSPEPNANGNNNNNNDSAKNGHEKDCALKASTMSHDPTTYVARARVTRPTPPKPSCNPMQFVQIKPCNLYQSAQKQLKKVEEIKKVKEVLKEEPEDWQNNLDSWKSSRRKRVEHIIDRVVEVKKLEQEEHDRTRRKSKTFSEMMEERGERGRARPKLQSLASYNEDEANDLSDLGIGTSSASGKSSISEDCEVHSIVSEPAEVEHLSSFDNENNSCQSCHDDHNRDEISSPGYETSSTAPVASPDPYEYTYEGAIEDYKSRVSKATAASSYKKPVENSIPRSLVFDRKPNSIDYDNDSESNVVTVKKEDLPKIDISKKRELFEKPEITKRLVSPSSMQNHDQIEKKRIPSEFANVRSIKDRLCSLEKKPESADEPTTGILSGEISSIKERLQCLEQQKQQNSVNPKPNTNKVGADVVAVPPLKDRLSSLQNAVTKEEIVKKPVVLVDEYQLEMLKNEELARRQLDTSKDDSVEKAPSDDSGINTTDEKIDQEPVTTEDEDYEEEDEHKGSRDGRSPLHEEKVPPSTNEFQGEFDSSVSSLQLKNLNTPTVVSLVDKPVVVDVGGGNTLFNSSKVVRNDDQVNHAQNLLKMFNMAFKDDDVVEEIVTPKKVLENIVDRSKTDEVGLANKQDSEVKVQESRVPWRKTVDSSAKTSKIPHGIPSSPLKSVSKANLPVENILEKSVVQASKIPQGVHVSSSKLDQVKELEIEIPTKTADIVEIVNKSLVTGSKTPAFEEVTCIDQILTEGLPKEPVNDNKINLKSIAKNNSVIESLEKPKEPEISSPKVEVEPQNVSKLSRFSAKPHEMVTNLILNIDNSQKKSMIPVASKIQSPKLDIPSPSKNLSPTSASPQKSPNFSPVYENVNFDVDISRPNPCVGLKKVDSPKNNGRVEIFNSKSMSPKPKSPEVLPRITKNNPSENIKPEIQSKDFQQSAMSDFFKDLQCWQPKIVGEKPKQTTDIAPNPIVEATDISSSPKSPEKTSIVSKNPNDSEIIENVPKSESVKISTSVVNAGEPTKTESPKKTVGQQTDPIPFESCVDILQSFLAAERSYPAAFNRSPNESTLTKKSNQTNSGASDGFLRQETIVEVPCSKLDVKDLPDPNFIRTPCIDVDCGDKLMKDSIKSPQVQINEALELALQAIDQEEDIIIDMEENTIKSSPNHLDAQSEVENFNTLCIGSFEPIYENVSSAIDERDEEIFSLPPPPPPPLTEVPYRDDAVIVETIQKVTTNNKNFTERDLFNSNIGSPPKIVEEEPYYQVPKSCEPLYQVPKLPKPIPLYENIEMFCTARGEEYTAASIPLHLQPPKEKPPPPPTMEAADSDDADDDEAETGSAGGSSTNTYETIPRGGLADNDDSGPPIMRMNSTKRIKKEMRNKRSSFLGIEGSDDSFLELTVVPPPDMVQLLQEERRLEKQLYIKAGLYDNSDAGESRDSGVSENHSRQSSEPFTNSSDEPDHHEELLAIHARMNHNAEQQRLLMPQNQINMIPGIEEANAKMQCIEDQIREQEEVLRVERELLQLEQEELKRQRDNLILRENIARRELQHGAKMLMSANRRSLQDLNASINTNNNNNNIYANIQNQQVYQIETDYCRSMSDLPDFRGSKLSQLPPTKPTRSQMMPEEHVQMRMSQPNVHMPTSHANMTRNALHALSATPKPKYNDAWVHTKKEFSENNVDNGWLSYQQKRKSVPDTFNYNKHWLVQEAEQRRVEQQRGMRNTNGWIRGVNCNNVGVPPNTNTGGNKDNKPLPDAVIQTLTQRVQSKGIGERKRFEDSPAIVPNHQIGSQSILHNSSPTRLLEKSMHQHQHQQQQDKILSVSGKKKCSHCGDELGRGAAMIIESLGLFYHINCFKCCVCHLQLSDGRNGTDVRVRNHKLHCQNCYSSDDGIKFSCV